MLTQRQHHNTGINSNRFYSPRDPVPYTRRNEEIAVGIPLTGAKMMHLGNKPLHHVQDYTSNQKTMVSEMFTRKNLNEKLNFKNTFYTSERNPRINAEALTIFGHDKVFLKETDDANRRANMISPMHIKSLEDKENKIRDFLRRTEEIADERKDDRIEDSYEELEVQKEEVRKLFMKMKRVVRHIIKADITHDSVKFGDIDEDEIVKRGDMGKIKGTHRDLETVTSKTTNIRQMLGYKSDENQDRIRKAHEERERLEAEEAAKQADEERKEKAKIDKYSDLKNLQQKWRIFDKTKLKETIRNEIVKEMMREEEQKNYKSMAQNRMKQHQDERRKIQERTQELEKKKQEEREKEKERQRPKEVPKQAVIPEGKLEKTKNETQAEFIKRQALFNLTRSKKKPTAYKAHTISKNFVEMAIEKVLKNNAGAAVSIKT